MSLAKLSLKHMGLQPAQWCHQVKDPQNRPCAHKKNNHLWKGDFWISLYWDPKIFFRCSYSPGLIIQAGTSKLPCQLGGGTDDGNVMSPQERQRSSCSPLSSSDYKNISHWILRAAQYLPVHLWTLQASYSNKSFFSLTLPLAEFLSELRHKGMWCRSSLEPWKWHLTVSLWLQNPSWFLNK